MAALPKVPIGKEWTEISINMVAGENYQISSVADSSFSLSEVTGVPPVASNSRTRINGNEKFPVLFDGTEIWAKSENAPSLDVQIMEAP